MSEPEIARRCKSCGVSVRVRALFCPQCGNALAEKPNETVGLAESKEKATNAENTLATAIGWETAHDTAPLDEFESDKVTALPNREQAGHTAVQAVPETIHRGTDVVRGKIEDDPLHRVQRLAKMSSVMLEEASYDPSLRFVIVAAVLFVIFLLILVLSKWIA
jgi:hypothetical protein